MKPCKVEKTRKDKSDRATVDKVLDKKTIAIIEKLVKRGKLHNLGGSICTGKEANVYLANSSTSLYSKFVNNIHELDDKENKNVFNMKNFQSFLNKTCEDSKDSIVESMKKHFENVKKAIEENETKTELEEKEIIIPVAIKIYKTSTMLFKDRERYIESEQRFKRFCTSNSRKLIKLWAEKEVRNLKRINKAEIPSPVPIYLKRNVLIMTLIGEENNVAPRLKDANMHDIQDCYSQCLDIMYNMYNKAGLIHSDFSEYNLLYKDKTVYVIDVGQSVETSHINANHFLIMDIRNITNFFKRVGADVNSINDTFEKITQRQIPDYLRDIDVTKNTFIPTRLSEISNIEDIKMFIQDACVDGNLDVGNEHILLDEKGPRQEAQTRLIDNLDRKEKKRLTKEFNRERRLSRISKKEKNRIFKKYKGKKNKSR